MNYFLALRPTAAARERLATIAERLQRWEYPARWVHPDDYHITIAFLGQLGDSELRSVPWAVNDVGHALLAPSLHLPGLGAFGGAHEPRVVYAAVGDPDGWCDDLHADCMEALGESVEARFKPHITLCRPNGRDGGRRDWRTLFEACGQALWGSMEVDAFGFFVSQQGTPRYQLLESWPIPALDRRSA